MFFCAQYVFWAWFLYLTKLSFSTVFAKDSAKESHQNPKNDDLSNPKKTGSKSVHFFDWTNTNSVRPIETIQATWRSWSLLKKSQIYIFIYDTLSAWFLPSTELLYSLPYWRSILRVIIIRNPPPKKKTIICRASKNRIEIRAFLRVDGKKFLFKLSQLF